MFETLLRMSASGSLESDRRFRSLPLSLALHGLAIGVVALLSLRPLTTSPEPQLPIVFFEGSAPALPLGDGLPPSPAPEATEAHAVTLAEPTATASSEEPSPAANDGSSEEAKPTAGSEGDEGGREKGVSSGTPGSDGKHGTEPGDSQKPLVIGGNVIEPRLLHRVEPPYPDTARKAHLEGVVILQAVIGYAGEIEELRVLKSIQPLLDEAALRAVGQWRYRAATLNGRAVRVYLTVTVEFRLR